MFFEVGEHAVGAVELEVEPHFVALDVEAVVFIGDGFGVGVAVEEFLLFFFGGGFVEPPVFVEFAELVFGSSGFGGDGAAVSPEGVGDFDDEELLEGGIGAEFFDEVVEEGLVLGGVLVEVFGADDDVFGEEAVFGVVTGDGCFAFGGFGAGGFLSVLDVGRELFFGNGHSYSLLSYKESAEFSPLIR